MLKVNLGCNNVPDMIAGSGDIRTIAAEVGAVIAGIYTQLNANVPTAALVYKTYITHLVTTPDSSLWDGDSKADFGIMSIIPTDNK